jgi:hypothetical protein
VSRQYLVPRAGTGPVGARADIFPQICQICAAPNCVLVVDRALLQWKRRGPAVLRKGVERVPSECRRR